MRLREELESSQARDSAIEREVRQLDQKITKAVGELQQLEQQKQQMHSNHEPLRGELKSRLTLLRNKRQTLEEKQQAKAAIEANVKALSDQQNAHEAELATEFKKALTEAEESQLESLTAASKRLREQYVTQSAVRTDLETRKSVLEVELNDNLRPSLEQLQVADLDRTEGNSSKGTLKECQRELKRLTQAADALSQRLGENEKSMEAAATDTVRLTAQNAEIRKRQEDLAKAIERGQRRMERSSQKKAVLEAQLAVTTDAIRALGLLPEDALRRYQHSDVVRRLHKVNESLKKFSHVNKKAFEQYNSFTKQGADLRSRRKELEESHKAIEDLVEVLDQRKDTVRPSTAHFHGNHFPLARSACQLPVDHCWLNHAYFIRLLRELSVGFRKHSLASSQHWFPQVAEGSSSRGEPIGPQLKQMMTRKTNKLGNPLRITLV